MSGYQRGKRCVLHYLRRLRPYVMIVHHLHLLHPYQPCSLQVVVIAIARSTGKGVGSATLVVGGDISGETLSVTLRKGIPMHVLHQGVRVGVVARAIAIVGMEGVEAKVEEDKGYAFTLLTTGIAATGKRASGSMKTVIVRGTGLMSLL